MKALELRIFGVVQGVGFRPFIVRLAKSYGLFGWVSNEGGAVHILIKGEEAKLNDFLIALECEKPERSLIIAVEKRVIPPEFITVDEFQIQESEYKEEDLVFVPPDFALCPDCLKELQDPNDRRFNHPFISCMVCGPRWTIINQVPYDRQNTTMDEFPMCEACESEYTDRLKRRYHAQTISCHQCGPELIYRSKEKQTDLKGKEALQEAIKALREGKIVAVKGIGGYHFACTPFIKTSVEALRELKGRETKPFAVLFKDLAGIKKYCLLDSCAQEVLTSTERPIILLPKKITKGSLDFTPEVDGESSDHGVFLPYTPLQVLLVNKTGPLIMTSANISGEPIIHDEQGILNFDHPLFHGVLSHQRQINIPIDDSVVRCIGKDVQILRRARGYAPLPIFLKTALKKKKQVLALGGMLKNSFCLTKGPFAYLSQHLGDLSTLRAWDNYLNNLTQLKKLLKIEPEIICTDLHPDYPTTRYARTLTENPLKVQHHYAHIASVMAEKGLEKEVLGVSFDGTGYGTDGKIWGGEFLLCSPQSFQRIGHLAYTSLPGGDKALLEGWKAGAIYLYLTGREDLITDSRWPVVKVAWVKGIQTVDSSSMGRLFDGVSSILGICHESRYEGEAAILLEQAALQWKRKNLKENFGLSYRFNLKEVISQVEFLPAIRQLAEEKQAGRAVGALAYAFHHMIAQATAELCQELSGQYHVKDVALSGGVFQNRLLLEKVVRILKEEGLTVHYNLLVPPNDGGISLGQAWVGLHQG